VCTVFEVKDFKLLRRSEPSYRSRPLHIPGSLALSGKLFAEINNNWTLI
jgi:hypothetical protein